MQYFLLLFLLFFLSACQNGDVYDDAYFLSRQVEIQVDGMPQIRGWGVSLHPGLIMTNTHIITGCIDDITRCRIDGIGPVGIMTSSGSDVAYIRLFTGSSIGQISPVVLHDGERVFYYSGASRVMTTLIDTDASYVGYREGLTQPGVFTGAIVLSGVLVSGMSGTPVWSLSGDLIGVVSAVNNEEGRVYVVR